LLLEESGIRNDLCCFELFGCGNTIPDVVRTVSAAKMAQNLIAFIFLILGLMVGFKEGKFSNMKCLIVTKT
jgi:hypothetical protein